MNLLARLTSWFRHYGRRGASEYPPPVLIPDLEAEAAASEVGYFAVRDRILHVRKYSGPCRTLSPESDRKGRRGAPATRAGHSF